MIKIAFVIGYTIWISTALGLFLQSRFNLNTFKFSAPLGFAALIALLQILYYPAQLFNWPSLYIHTISFIVYGVLTIYSLTKIKAIFKDYIRLEMLYVIAYLGVFLFLLYSVSISIPKSDTQMYLNYIAQNININKLNNFNLWTGLEGQEFVTVYLFQGYYHFASFVSYFVNVFHDFFTIGSFIENIVISVWGLGLLYGIISSLAIINMVSIFKFEKKWIHHLLILFSLFFTNMYYWKISFAFYGNTWRSLWMATMMMYIYLWIKEKNQNYRILTAIAFGASIASSSSSLFIGFAIIYGLTYYLFSTNQKNIFRDLSYIALPMVLFVLAIKYKDAPNQLLILLPITISYYVFHRTVVFKEKIDILEKALSKHSKVLFIGVIPVLAIAFSFYDMNVDPNYPWNFFHYFNNHAAYDMMKDYLFIHSRWYDNLLNLLRWLAVIILISKTQKSNEKSYLVSHLLMMAVFFLNPLTTSFISKAFASNVYYRSYEALFNVFTEILLFGLLLNWSASVKRTVYPIVLIFIIAIGISHFESLVLKDKAGQYGFYVVEGESVLPLYKIKASELDIIKNFENIIQDYSTQNKQITIVSHADGLRTFTPNVYVVFTARQYWSSWDRIDQDFYQVAQRLQGWDERPNVDYSLSCSYLQKYKIDFVVNEIWENDEFDSAINACTNVLYENYEYRIREVTK